MVLVMYVFTNLSSPLLKNMSHHGFGVLFILGIEDRRPRVTWRDSRLASVRVTHE